MWNISVSKIRSCDVFNDKYNKLQPAILAVVYGAYIYIWVCV